MCTSNTGTTMLPYGMKLPGQSPYMPFGSNMAQFSLDIQRAQLQEYTNRLQLGIRSYPGAVGLNTLSYHNHLADPYLHPYFYKDPRARFVHEEPKPNHSYIGLIAMAILSVRDKKLVLSDIYQWILDNYSYFRTRGPGWRNSIRHNLSLNDCFIKSGRSANGKGHYWAIHPANLEDFQKGDFRRRRAQRRVRKHMGLAVPDDDDSPSPSPSTSAMPWADKADEKDSSMTCNSEPGSPMKFEADDNASNSNEETVISAIAVKSVPSRKRMFDMDSLLAPDHGTKSDRQVNPIEATSGMQAPSERCVTDMTTAFTEEENSMPEAEIRVDNGSERECDSAGVGGGEQRVTSVIVRDGASSDSDPRIPHGAWKTAGTSGRPSAFQSLGQYGWASLPGYLSSYQLMALNASAGHQSLVVHGTGAGQEALQRWHQSMTHFLAQNRPREQVKEDN